MGLYWSKQLFIVWGCAIAEGKSKPAIWEYSVKRKGNKYNDQNFFYVSVHFDRSQS